MSDLDPESALLDFSPRKWTDLETARDCVADELEELEQLLREPGCITTKEQSHKLTLPPVAPSKLSEDMELLSRFNGILNQEIRNVSIAGIGGGNAVSRDTSRDDWQVLQGVVPGYLAVNTKASGKPNTCSNSQQRPGLMPSAQEILQPLASDSSKSACSCTSEADLIRCLSIEKVWLLPGDLPDDADDQAREHLAQKRLEIINASPHGNMKYNVFLRLCW